jgi:hypothetical protein
MSRVSFAGSGTTQDRRFPSGAFLEHVKRCCWYGTFKLLLVRFVPNLVLLVWQKTIYDYRDRHRVPINVLYDRMETEI